jgi:DNA adenine methylase
VNRSGLRPFLKWVGGKRQLLPALRRFYPATIGAYFEPFLGSGAVFFDLIGQQRLDGGITLSDANPDLIGCYRRVGDSLDAVVAELERLAAGHAEAGDEHYLRVRNDCFNPQRAAWRADGARLDRYPSELAATLIYLNRTGYNGLFRVNAAGDYNVPPGRYDRPRIVNRPALAAASHAIAAPQVQLRCGAFDEVLQDAAAGDFVYFDPPYAPMSATANFRGYTGRGFDATDQERLQAVLVALAERGVAVLLSNSTAPEVSRLYEDNPETARAGLRAWRVPARRAVNSRPDRRGAIEELVVSNVAPASA